MSRFNFRRLDNLLNYLIQKDTPTPVREISVYCGVSDRTIRSDIKIINDYISVHGASIRLIRKQGYILTYNDRQKFYEFWNAEESGTLVFASVESRLKYLLQLFLTSDEFISFDYLESVLFVSQNTLYNDFRTLRQNLSEFSLKLQNKSNLGYRLVGQEVNKRSAIVNLIFKEDIPGYLSGPTLIEKDLCINIDYYTFSEIFDKYFNNIIHPDSDYFHRNLFTNLLLTTSRVKNNHNVLHFNKKIQLNTETISARENFIYEVEQTFDILFSVYEKNYIDFIIAENYPGLIDDALTFENQNLASDITQTILESLAEFTDSSWIDDNDFKNNLLKHLKLFLKVQTIKGHRANPILDTIKNSFPYAFELAIACSQRIINEYNIYLSEDEISYIALHFENAIEKNKGDSRKFSLGIICGSGKIFSSIIESKIKRKFPNTFDEIQKFSFSEFNNFNNRKQLDLILSTVPINRNSFKYDIIFIDIDHLDQSMDLIQEKLEEIKTITKVNSLFSPDRFLYLKEKTTKMDLLNRISEILYAQKYVKANFLDEIKKREDISSTVIGEIIALPHPLGDCVIENSIFSVIAPKGIRWDDKVVKFVFVFAIKNQDSENIQILYEQMLDFISSDQLQYELLKNPSFSSLSNFFSQHSYK